jgi:hypothetical protein
MSGAKIVAWIHFVLVVSALAYLVVRVALVGSVSDFDYWIIGTFAVIIVFQAVVSFTPPVKFASYFIGIAVVPVVIVSCVMGYFWFYHYRIPNVLDYQKTGFFWFLELNFVIFVLASGAFIRKGLGIKGFVKVS